jgi:hypothetical protein
MVGARGFEPPASWSRIGMEAVCGVPSRNALNGLRLALVSLRPRESQGSTGLASTMASII